MDFRTFHNYLFIPDAAKANCGTVYELSKSDAFAPNSFVLLPYQNPQTGKTTLAFYHIKHKYLVEDVVTKKNTREKRNILLKSNTTKETYYDKINQLKKHIQLGNIYEINYCISFFAEDITLSPLELFFDLHALAKAPYAALLKLENDFIISASPELFLKKEGDLLFTKPIKGTIKRGQTEAEDLALKNHLHHNIKERTENVMAVDVARNDLSQIAQKGSVQVNKLYNIETFETVHQMVSTVSCNIKEGKGFKDIIEATFPMASMTGAPKLRAMTLIDAFEDFERKTYSGAMGLIDEKGDFTLSVIIRSIFYNQETKHLSLAVGGAITYLCEAEQEYEECLLKAQGLLKVLDAKII